MTDSVLPPVAQRPFAGRAPLSELGRRAVAHGSFCFGDSQW